MTLKHLVPAALVLTFPIAALAQSAPQTAAPSVAAPAAAGAAPATPAPKYPNTTRAITPVASSDLLKSLGDEWLTYHGDYSARHYSSLGQITPKNISKLKRVWVSETNDPVSFARRRGGGAFAPDPRLPGVNPPGPPGTPEGGSGQMKAGVPATFGAAAVQLPPRATTANGGIRSAPIVRSGVIFYTLGQNAYAIDARTGKQIWHYVAESSGGLSNRGLALSGDTLFMMANGGLTAINAATGAEIWRKVSDGLVPATAPVVVGNHVIFGIGFDTGGNLGWLESRDVKTGDLQWRWLATPRAGEEGIETWPSPEAAAKGAGTPWQALSYDPELNLLYIGTGNPAPTKDGRTRPGDNLWTSSVVALNPDDGRMAWFFQMTPHDDHDYDGNQTIMLFNAKLGAQDRKLLGVVGRGGYTFLLDRVTGKNIYTKKFFETSNWAFPALRENGTPEPNPAKSPSRGGSLVSPSSEGATNFPASAYSPQTGLFYANTVNSWSIFYNQGETWFGDFRSSVKAIDAKTGKIVWEHDYAEPYGVQARYPGVLATAGGVIFSGDVSGNAVAFDARTGKVLWHDRLEDAVVTNSPESFVLDGRQYMLVGSGEKLYAYALE